jgi:hypothetical protein
VRRSTGSDIPEVIDVGVRKSLGSYRRNLLCITGADAAFWPAAAFHPALPVSRNIGRRIIASICAHLVIVLLALAVAGDPKSEIPLWVDVALIGGSFAVLYTIARVFNPMHPRGAVGKEGSAGLTVHAAR